MELLGLAYVARQRRYADGIALLERAAATRPDDAGIWYSLGWCCEFAAHEIRRRGDPASGDPRALYERAEYAFCRCLKLGPGGKLADDAADLLDHVENALRSL